MDALKGIKLCTSCKVFWFNVFWVRNIVFGQHFFRIFNEWEKLFNHNRKVGGGSRYFCMNHTLLLYFINFVSIKIASTASSSQFIGVWCMKTIFHDTIGIMAVFILTSIFLCDIIFQRHTDIDSTSHKNHHVF